MDTLLVPYNDLNGFHLDVISNLATENNYRIGLVHNYSPNSQDQLPNQRGIGLEQMKAVFSKPELEQMPHRCFVREGSFKENFKKLEKQSNSKLIVLSPREDIETVTSVINRASSSVISLPESRHQKETNTLAYISNSESLDYDVYGRMLVFVKALSSISKIMIISTTDAFKIDEAALEHMNQHNIKVEYVKVDNLLSDETCTFISHISPDCVVMRSGRSLFNKIRNPGAGFFKVLLKNNIPIISI